MSLPDFSENTGLFLRLREELKDLIPFDSQPVFLLGLSGGLDSVFLLYFLIWLRGREGFCVRAAHFNHHLRPGDDEEEIAFLEDLCSRYEVPLYLGGEDVESLAKERGAGVEEAARFARYTFFERCLKEEGQAHPSYLCLAHQLNDQAETLLLQLSRGSGLSGLSAMRQLDGYKLRPLLHLRRETMHDFMKSRELSWCEDVSNQEPRYRRNRVRLELLPLWADIAGDNLIERLARAADNLAVEDDLLEMEAREAFEKARNGSYLICHKLAGLHPARAYRVIRLWLKEEGDYTELSERQFAQLWKLISSPDDGVIHLGSGTCIRKSFPLLKLSALS